MSDKHLGNSRLTVIILTLNNADTIAECINSVDWADEILVYDSGSSDDTQSIAEKLGVTFIVDLDWSGFGVQRQKAQKHAKGEWLLWIDSDEVVTPELKKNIQQNLVKADDKQAFSMNRVTDFFGRFIRHSGWHPDRIVRLYARDSYQYDAATVHEKVSCPGDRVTSLEGDLLHYTSNSFWIYMSKSLRYADDWAKQKYSKGKKVTVVGIIMRSKFAFFRKYILKKGFLDGKHGFLLAVQSSHYTFNKYFALWVLCKNKTPTQRSFHKDK
ncbi:MAG: glycosyltransferase family 2 protein [Cellvibrionaceae bacterium]